MLTTLIVLSIVAAIFIIASIVDCLMPNSTLFPSAVTRAIKGQRDVSGYLYSLAMLERDGPYRAGHAFDDLMRRHIELVSSSSSRHTVLVNPSDHTLRAAVTLTDVAKAQDAGMDDRVLREVTRRYRATVLTETH